MKSLEAQNAQKQGKIDSLEKKLANIKEKAKAKVFILDLDIASILFLFFCSLLLSRLA